MLSIEEHRDASGALCLTLAGDAAIQHAAELHRALVAALQRERTVRLDITRVEQLDLSCLQLLCAAHHSALSAKKCLSFDQQIPERFSELLRSSGFGRSRGCAQSLEPESCLWAWESTA